MQKMRQGDQFQTSFCFMKKHYIRKKDNIKDKRILYKIKESVKHPSFNTFWWTFIWIYNKNNFVVFQTVSPEKGLEIVSPPHLLYDFLKKSVSCVIFYQLTKFHCLIAFTS